MMTDLRVSSRERKQAIRSAILHAFGAGFEAEQKNPYVAIRLAGTDKNVAAIFGSRKGGLSLWVKAAVEVPSNISIRDVSKTARGFQQAIDIKNEEDPAIAALVQAVKESLVD